MKNLPLNIGGPGKGDDLTLKNYVKHIKALQN